MPTFEITTPNGKTYEITGPNKAGALKALKAQLADLEKAQAPINPRERAAQVRALPEDQREVPSEAAMREPSPEDTGAAAKGAAFTTGFTEGLPIVGPTALKGVNAIAAGIVTPFSDKSFGENYDDMGGIAEKSQRDNPNWATGGRVAGAVAPMLALGGTTLGAQALGVTGRSLGTRALASGVSNAGINMADTAARGGDVGETLKSGGIGVGIGVAVPFLGAGLNQLWRAGAETLGPRINALTNPVREGSRRVTTAMEIDAKNAAAPVINSADEASAALNGQELLNVDRGGQTSRSLLRSAVNQDPDALGSASVAVADRFASQGDRATTFIDRISRGAADSQAAKDAISTAAKKSNPIAYGKAYKAPAAQDMSNPELLNLLQSPAMREAAKQAETRSANRAVVDGFSPVKSPFVIDEAGAVSMKPGVKPTLQFWDQVKRNLDADIGKASRAGDKTAVADLTALKSKLVSELDAAVPEYKAARQGAMAFFDAEDALDAGRKFVMQNRTLPEAQKALAAMNPTERAAFAVGFASEMKEAIKATGDSVNVTKKLFGSEQARQKILLALGKKNYQEFEQFVKVENTMDLLRGALGNSTSVRQLMELGLAHVSGSVGSGVGAGGATFMMTGDWKKTFAATAIAGLTRRYGLRADATMTKQIAQLLLSNDPTALQRAATMAARNPVAAEAVEAIQSAIGLAVKGAGIDQARPPLEITATTPRGPDTVH
jgi:hypothetical protein